MDNICLYLNYLPELPTEFPKNFVNHFDFVSGIKGIKKFLKLEKNKEKLFKSEFINYYTFVKFKPTSVTLSTCTEYDIFWTIDIELNSDCSKMTFTFTHEDNKFDFSCDVINKKKNYKPTKLFYMILQNPVTFEYLDSSILTKFLNFSDAFNYDEPV